jgi:hypothetical protein
VDTERRFLVIVRAGETSLHRRWLEGGARNWDLVVSWYGDVPYEPVADEQVWPQQGLKWDVYTAQLQAHPEVLEKYAYFVFADDDVEITTEAINTLFETAESEKLEIAQPGLTADSYFSAIHHLRSPSFRLRYSSYVEVMFPCLSRAALLRVLPYASDTPTGQGLDLIWARLEPDNRKRAAIIDTIEMRHTRPVGSVIAKKLAARGVSNQQIGQALLRRFGLPPRKRHLYCYAAITAKGKPVGLWGTRWRMAVDALRGLPRWPVAGRWRKWQRLFLAPRTPFPITQVRSEYEGPLRQTEPEDASH